MEPEAWLEGTGWDVVRWGAWPTAADLDRAAPGRPAFLWSHELHQVWVSSAALAAAGIDAATPDPPDGRIRRDEDGAPTGMLHEGASKLVTRHAPEPTREWLEAAIEAYCRSLLAYGIVAVHDLAQLIPDVDLTGGIAIIERLADAGRLPVRVHQSIRTEALDLAIERGLRSGAPLGESDRARFGWLKVFGDGSLYSRTAYLLEPWEVEADRGTPPGGPRGMPTTSPRRWRRWPGGRRRPASRPRSTPSATRRFGRRSMPSGRSPPGDGAAGADRALPVRRSRGRGPVRGPRRRGVDPADPPPRRCPLGADRAGRAGGADRLRLADASPMPGAMLAIGADAPYEDVDPWPGLELAVTRSDPTWPAGDVFGAHEALTLEQAIRAACLHPALTAGETDRGRLTPGSWADLMVIPAAAIDEPTRPGGPLSRVRPRLVLDEGVVVHEA